MAVDNSYKEFICVSKLSADLKKRFIDIVNTYGDKLSDRVILNNSVFTLHDFNHHCIDLYNNISAYILDSRTAFNNEYGLSDRELFILDLAVLFHDYSMFNFLDATRENHSRKSADFIKREYEDTRSAFRKFSDLTQEELKALMVIMEAHSNIKDGTVQDDENGINSPKLKNYTSKGARPIRAGFLAGVLRLADELDVTSARLGDAFLETQLEELNSSIKLGKIDKTDQRYDRMIESLEFWKLQHYFSFLELKDDGDLCIHIDEEYIQKAISEEGESPDKVKGRIAKAHKKICDEYNSISKKLFSNRDVSFYVAIRNISLESVSFLEKE